MSYTADDLDTLTRTLWGECRGESGVGQAAVAWVVRNRLWMTRAWGMTIGQVCRARGQFSCWNTDSVELGPMLHLLVGSDEYEALREVARDALNGTSEDPSFGATFYQVVGTKASWSLGRSPMVTIGRHEFYRLTVDGREFQASEIGESPS